MAPVGPRLDAINIAALALAAVTVLGGLAALALRVPAASVLGLCGMVLTPCMAIFKTR